MTQAQTHMSTSLRGRRARRASSEEGRPALKRFFSVFTEPQTALNLIYLVLAFPLGVAYFVALVTVISTSAGLLITILGAPLFIVAVYAWCLLGDIEGVLTNGLLGTHISPSRFAGETGRPLGWTRTKARLTNLATWRTLIFLFIRFPLGIATFVASVTLIATSLGLIVAPFTATLGKGLTLGFWDIDTWWEGALLVPLGLILFPISLHLLNLLAEGCGSVAEFFLGVGDGDVNITSANAAAEAAVSWTGLSLSRPATSSGARVQIVQVRIFFISLGVCFAIGAAIVLINALATPGHWWSMWVIWPACIVLAFHAGYLLRGWIGAHAGLFLSVNAGLIVIDFRYSPNHWFFWPLSGWAILLVVHDFVDIRYRRGQPLIPALLPAKLAGDDVEAEAGTSAEAFVVAELPPAVSVDVAMRSVRVNGVPVELTPKEFDLLSLFVQNPGRPFSREDLLDRIWKSDYEITDRTVDTHVLRLRKKLGGESDAIQTVWGVGYKYGAEK